MRRVRVYMYILWRRVSEINKYIPIIVASTEDCSLVLVAIARAPIATVGSTAEPTITLRTTHDDRSEIKIMRAHTTLTMDMLRGKCAYYTVRIQCMFCCWRNTLRGCRVLDVASFVRSQVA